MDGEFLFLIQGNATEPFQVRFLREADRLTATCTCNAGLLGKLCKHRLGLLRGDLTGLVSGNQEQVPRIPDLFKGSDGEVPTKGLLEAEAALDHAQANFTLAKLAFLDVVRT